MLTGDNGILTQAGRANMQNEIAQEKEGIALAVNYARIGKDNYQNLDRENLQMAIDNQFGKGKAKVMNNENDTFTVSFNNTKREYNITSNEIKEGINWNEKMANAKAPDSQNRVNSNGEKVIGIGTDGNTVNMDLWEYILLSDDTYSVKYINNESNIIDGKIIGSIPQYINDEGQFKEVTNLENCFIDNNNIKYPPKIPNTVIRINGTFANCTNLEKAPVIPYGVEEMISCFSGCSNLREMPNIPSSVKSLSSTFVGCELIENMKNIPESIEYMNHTFNGCKRLKNISNIPKNVKSMTATFSGCSSLTYVDLSIPETVTDLRYTFQYCSNLTGNIRIDAKVNGSIIGGLVDYKNCFVGAATSEKTKIEVSGKCVVIKEIVLDSLNSNITYK